MMPIPSFSGMDSAGALSLRCFKRSGMRCGWRDRKQERKHGAGVPASG